MMKKIYLILFTLIPSLTFAQNKIRCSTDENWEQMKREDPSLIETEKNINRDINDWITQHA